MTQEPRPHPSQNEALPPMPLEPPAPPAPVSLPEVDSPPPEALLDELPSPEQVVSDAQSVDEVIAGQPSVDELLGETAARHPDMPYSLTRPTRGSAPSPARR